MNYFDYIWSTRRGIEEKVRGRVKVRVRVRVRGRGRVRGRVSPTPNPNLVQVGQRAHELA